MRLPGILETCLYVDDLEAAEQFYGDVLRLELVGRQDCRHVFFRCGKQMLLIFDPAASSALGGDLPPHGTQGPGHVAFTVNEAELDTWQQRLKAVGVEIEQTIDWPQGGRSFYFRDPAGNSLEMAVARIWGIEEES